MKKILLIAALLIGTFSYSQVALHKATKYLGITTTVRDNITIAANQFPVIYNSTTGQFERYNGATWERWTAGVTSADITDGTIDELDLDVSINASLDFANSSLQSLNGIVTGNITDGTIDILDLDAALQTSVGLADSAYQIADALPLTSLANINNDRLLGNVTGGLSNPQSITPTEVRTLINVEDGSTADQTAAEVVFTPNGSIAATDVQAAIQEVRDEAGDGGDDVSTFAEKTGALVGTDRLVGLSTATDFNETISGIPLSIFTDDLTHTAASTDDQTAAEVTIADAGVIITATDVEGALQENRTAIDLNTTELLPIEISLDSITAPNMTTTEIDNASPAVLITKEWFNINNTAASTAGDISISDAGGYYTGTTVEAALQEAATLSTASADIGASDITLADSNFSKINYTDNTITLTVDNAVTNNLKTTLQATNIDSIITVIPSAGISIIGNGSAAITDGFQIDSLNAATLYKAYANTYFVWGYVKPYASPSIPTIESFTKTWSGTSASSITVDKPANVATDDLLVVLVGGDDDAVSPFSASEAPTGFTFMKTEGTTDSDAFIAAYYRVADGTEAATFTVGTISPTQDMWVSCIRIDGANTTTPIGVQGAGTIAAFNSSITPTQITTVNDNSLVIAFASVDGSDMTYSSLSGTGWVLGEAVEGASSPDNANGIWVYKEQPAAGLTGSPTINYNISDGIVSFMFSINPE